MPKINPRVTLFDVENTVFEFPDLETAVRACVPDRDTSTPRWSQRERLNHVVAQNLLRFFDDYGEQIAPGDVIDILDAIFARKKAAPQPFRAGPIHNTGRRSNGRMWRLISTTAERRANIAFVDEADDLRLHVDQIGRRRKLPSTYDDPYKSRLRNWKAHRASQWK